LFGKFRAASAFFRGAASRAAPNEDWVCLEAQKLLILNTKEPRIGFVW
jgi:hypothetical protein